LSVFSFATTTFNIGMDRFVLGEELISTQRGHAQITNGTVLIPLPRSRKRGSHVWTSDAANHAQQQDAVRPAAEILGRAGGRLGRICPTTGSDGGAQLRPSALPTTRCSAGGTARARSGTSVAISSEQRVVVAREGPGPGLPPGAEMAVGGRQGWGGESLPLQEVVVEDGKLERWGRGRNPEFVAEHIRRLPDNAPSSRKICGRKQTVILTYRWQSL
jgi:hypothetical protein